MTGTLGSAPDLELNMKGIRIVVNLKIVFVVIGLAACSHAATNVFVEAVPPKGVVTGYMQARGRYGAVVRGKGLVYSNDLFTVVADGYKTTWKVLELTPEKKRFARGDSLKAAPSSKAIEKTKPRIVPTSKFQNLVMLLENMAVKYRAATTKVQKEEKKSKSTIVASESSAGNTAVSRAFRSRSSDVQVNGSGRVIKILSDDREGSKHQRFILKLNSGQTLLVAHNIDLAPRINSLRTGDTVEFYGEYEWNSQGGVIHWTHHDPPGGSSHVGGWLKHKGRMYK